MDSSGRPPGAIAIVGMACRFPGAADPAAFWRNLRAGVESIRFFSDAELAAAGVDPETLRHPHYVKAAPVLENVEEFDAAFFGYSPREATVTDPQHRLFLEVAWEAFEEAGYHPESAPGVVGVFAGAGGIVTSYLVAHAHHPALAGDTATLPYIGNDKDFLATRVSYKLNLTGPSLTVQTACSTSLVAVHLACQSLLSGESDLALAGAATVRIPQIRGYFAEPGNLHSLDGHCRAFDAAGKGAVFGSGVAAVLLRRLEDALDAGDHIHAVIKGTSITNDGARKASFTAPSVTGQARAMVEALTIADVAPDTIGYVECHAAGTTVGDPLEIQALTRAFRTTTARSGFCAVGSVKGNLGHPEQAAGLAGLIKTALALEQRELPPSLHFATPNPAIDFATSPFFVNAALRDWPAGDEPRRAGVNSLGIGGTNAFAVLEQAPALTAAPKDPTRTLHVFTLSARTEAALGAYVERFRAFLREHPDADLGDLCYTANASRSQFEHRLAVTAASVGELAAKLERIAVNGGGRSAKSRRDGIAFLFTGQGAQHPGMAAGLYQAHPAFREVLDRCDAAFRPHLPRPLLEVMFAEPGESSSLIDQTAYTQPALFALEFGLAQLWQSWGVVPTAVMGHSLGEVVAACVAGAMEFDDAVRLVATRARLMQDLPERGAMVAVFAPEDAVRRALPNGDAVVIAAANSPQNTVVSGVREEVHALIERLTAQGVESRPLALANGFHSPLVEPMLDALEAAAGAVAWSRPRIAFVSNLTGQPIEGPLGPRYWRDHARQAVRFADGVRALDALGCNVFLEIGPGSTLLGIASQVLAKPDFAWVPSLSRQKPDWQSISEALQSLYLEGLPIDWEAVHRGALRRRLSLPTYPFQRKRYWVEELPADPPRAFRASLLPVPRERAEETDPRDASAEWLYRLQWEERPRSTNDPAAAPGSWLVLSDRGGVGAALAKALAARGDRCLLVFARNASRRKTSGATLDPGRPADFRRVVREACAAPALRGAIYLWALDAPPLAYVTPAELDVAERATAQGALLLSQALDEAHASGAFAGRLHLVTRNAQAVSASDAPSEAVQALLWGFGRTFALEHRELWGGLIDLPAAAKAVPGDVEALALDVLDRDAEDQLAYRSGRRFGARLVRIASSEQPMTRAPVFRGDATYLVTGGLGMIGLRTAQWLVEREGVRSLVLTGRGGARGAALDAVERLRRLGARVEVVPVDASIEPDVRRLMKELRGLPPLRGVIHGAGVLDNSVVRQMDWKRFSGVTSPKVRGAWLLHRATRGLDLDFFVLQSSVLSLIGSAGQANYTAANAFLDALGSHRRALGLPATVINWTAWGTGGLATTAGAANEALWHSIGLGYLSPDDGMRAFDRLMRAPVDQAAVAIANWPKYVQQFSARPALFADLVPDPVSAPATAPADIRTRLRETGIAGRRAVLVDAVREQVAGQMGFEQPVDTHVPLSELGLDSLMAANVASRLSAALDIPVPVVKLIRGPSIEQLVDELAPMLDGLGPSPEPRSARAPAIGTGTSKTDGDGWLVFPRPNPAARARLFCFPYAGGNAATYRPWVETLRPDVELVAIEPPGRASRVHEPVIDDLAAFYESLRPALAPYLDKPAAFYGHCLGGITLFEAARWLREEGAIDLRQIFVSSARPPRRLLRVGRFEQRLLKRLLELPKFDPLASPYEQCDEVFGELIRHFNIGATEEFLASAELRQLLMPAVRAEFRMASRYRFKPEPPWDAAITCFVGADDPYVTREDALAWSEHTRTDFRLHLREGDHFLVVDDRAFIMDAINRELAI